MRIWDKITILSMFFMTGGYSQDCTYILEKIYLNDQILTFYLHSFDRNNSQSQIDLFTYKIISSGDNCNQTIQIIYTLKIYAPEIGLTQYEAFYKGKNEIEINSEIQYIKNSDFTFVSGLTETNNEQTEQLISYISHSGKLPNGIYSIQFSSNNPSVILPDHEKIEIDRPISLEILSPGGTLSEDSYTYSTVPFFTWYSDFCDRCTYGIRVCEYNQREHFSLHDALSHWSLLPYDQSNEYHEIPWNTFSFQYPAEGHIILEVGKHYVWQIRRSYETTLDIHYDYSPIYIFEIRSPTKKQLDFSDPYLSAIQSLIGNEQFIVWFTSGGELERYVTAGESIWINGEELHIDALYSLVSELNQGKITLENLQIK